MEAERARCRRCGEQAGWSGQPHEFRLLVFEEAGPAQEETLWLCARCKAGFPTAEERDGYLEAAALA